MDNGNLRGAVPITEPKEPYYAKVPQLIFTKILDEENVSILLNTQVDVNDIFIIKEAVYGPAGSNETGRALYAQVKECQPVITSVIRSWRFWRKPEVKYSAFVVFKLTGVINIDGRDITLSSKAKDAIIKNLDCDDEIDLSLMPPIHCINDKNEFTGEFKFLRCLMKQDDIISLQYIKSSSREDIKRGYLINMDQPVKEKQN